MLELVLGYVINTPALCNKLVIIFHLPEIRFDDYQQYLRYTYKQAMNVEG